MATERDAIIEEARAAAIMEFRRAIISLETGEVQDAWNHSACAVAWLRELG